MKKIFALLLLMVPVLGMAQESEGMMSLVADSTKIDAIPTLAEADSAYIQGDYLTAISMYEWIVQNQGVNATLYMNLGNCWLKRDEVAKAILCYERAYLIDPSDPDIRFNLELARTKTVDKVNPVNQLFIVVWFKKLLAVLDVNGWAVLTVVLFAITILLAGVLLFSKKSGIRKISFSFSAFFLLLSILSFIFATTQMGNLKERDTAIIMSPSVTVKSTPSSGGTDLFIIHEGRKVKILDSSMKEWVEIRLEDGNTGWVPVNVMEII
ncbi:MAG: SH3 domain-containing protein [Bacteroidaceae bacterium]|nr:SH3 domain-containing protein [Bacteroidaceae bacterium]MBR4593749.1 SH3 domain-containing protein [Bacteroidaceae bacterium]